MSVGRMEDAEWPLVTRSHLARDFAGHDLALAAILGR